MKIVIASDNQHKIKEFKELFNSFNFEVISKKEAGILESIEETGSSFKENAKLKATAIFKKTSLPTLADDSGLEVLALNGEPGIFSARYSQTKNSPATDEKNNIKLLEKMKNIPNKKARYVCALCFINYAGEIHSILETVNGTISTKLIGENGFGYDPLFLYGEKSFAQIPNTVKNKISHRGKAMQKLLKNIKNWI